MKTIVIVGTGPLLGFSLARKFGVNGFQVAMIARNSEKLEGYESELKEQGIEASGFVADVYEKEQLLQAFDDIKSKYGQIDVLLFNSTAGHYKPTFASEVTEEMALDAVRGSVIAAVRSVQSVLPDMLKRGQGELLFTTGISSITASPFMSNIGLGLGALRNYVLNLNQELAPKGIYAGHFSVGVWIKPGTENDPDNIADAVYELYTKRELNEETFPPGANSKTIEEQLKIQSV